MASASAREMRRRVDEIAASRSRSFFVVLVAFIAGVAAAALVNHWFDDAWLSYILLVLLAAGLLLPARAMRFACLVLFALGLGVVRYNASIIPPFVPSVTDSVGKEVVYTGRAAELAPRDERTGVTLEGVTARDGTRLAGKMLVWVSPTKSIALGDELAFRCKTEAPKPFDGFAYDRYLASKGVYAICWHPASLDVRAKHVVTLFTLLASLRTTLMDTIGEVITEPASSFVSGTLFGGTTGLDPDLKQDFATTGLSHVMAASGYNVSIFTELILIGLMRSWLGRRRALYVVGALVVAYVILAGASPPIVRAGIMAAVVLSSLWFGRVTSMRNLLTLAAAIMLMANPRLLLDDVGFQLSFLATVGIVLLSARYERALAFIPNRFELRASAAASLAAIVMTTPVMLWQFGSFSVIAPIANLLVLPWIPYLMGAGAIALFVGLVNPWVGSIVGLPAWLLGSAVLQVIDWLAAVPFASVGVPFAHPVAVASAVVLGIYLAHLRRADQDHPLPF